MTPEEREIVSREFRADWTDYERRNRAALVDYWNRRWHEK
jgi:hypothetical protein